MVLHPLFNEFACDAFKGGYDEELGFSRYFTGARFEQSIYLDNHHTGMMSGNKILGFPDSDGETEKDEVERFHDVVEFIPLFEAVACANSPFSMIDLGAGFGFWAMHAAGLCRQQRKKFHLSMVEAEPEYFRLLTKTVKDNAIPDESVALYCAASVAPCDGIVEVNGQKGIPFIVGKPGVDSIESAREWYGQATARTARIDIQNAVQLDQEYYGMPLYHVPSGWSFILVPGIGLEEILKKREYTNLVVMDIQGEELRVIEAAASMLDKHLGAISIATHGVDIEDGLRRLFTGLGWERVLDYKMNSTNDTPMGSVYFYDGFQYYRNPKYCSGVGNSRLLPAFAEPSSKHSVLAAEVKMTEAWRCKDRELVECWEFCLYGADAENKKGLIVDKDGTTCAFYPTGIQDHVTTPFISLSGLPRGGKDIVIEARFPQGQPAPAGWQVNIQDSTCGMLSISPLSCCREDVWSLVAEIPHSVETIRLVFELREYSSHKLLLPKSLAILLP